MLNEYRLQDALVDYNQKYISNQWENEKFKWEAVLFFRIIGMRTQMIFPRC